MSGSAATDTVWIRTNRPCLSYFRPHRGVAELLFAGRLFPPVSKLGYRLRKYGYFGYYNVNENGSRKVLCTADGMNEDILPIQLAIDQYYERQMDMADQALEQQKAKQRLAALERKECASGC